MCRITKWRFFAKHEKEEQFLNDMMAKGYAMTNFRWGKYTFEKAPPGKYIYRIELLEYLPEHEESQQYIRFMEDTGAELVATHFRWAYFRKKAEEGEFCIYTDLDSKINHYLRIRTLMIVVAALNLFMGLINLNVGLFVEWAERPPFNLYLSTISFAVAALVYLFIILPLNKKIRFLQKEKTIRE